MKKAAFTTIVVLILIVASFSIAYADKPIQTDPNGNEIAWDTADGCATIQGGTITDSADNILTTGYDQYGYNYQAHMFNGTYDSVDRNIDGTYYGQTGDFVDDKLVMKWSDSWLANVDCNGDNKLDRGLVNGAAGGTSLGWLTNLTEGDYTLADGTVQNYTDFVKIVYVGSGPVWGAYEILQEEYNDPAGSFHMHFGAPGFGLNDQWTSP